MIPFSARNILVPVDLRNREESRKAVELAVETARPDGGTVSILSVVNPLGKHFTEGGKQHEPAFKSFVSEESTRLDYPIEALFRSHESPNRIIRETIEKKDTDLVIMSTHHPKLTDVVFGSHASQTALHADCSVFILRD